MTNKARVHRVWSRVKQGAQKATTKHGAFQSATGIPPACVSDSFHDPSFFLQLIATCYMLWDPASCSRAVVLKHLA